MDTTEKIRAGGKPLTLEAVREQFCIAEKREALEKIADRLESVWDIDKAAELTLRIARDMEAKIKEAGANWGPADRITWAVKEAFILGSLDMAETMMTVNDMGYAAIAGEGAEA